MDNSTQNISHTRPKIHRHAVQKELKTQLSSVKNIIAVGSGKGGVGKSTTAVNLALALLSLGARVGLLDADIYGPSLPLVLGGKLEKPAVIDQKQMLPLLRHGLQCMSIAYLIDAESPMIWRGPMVSQALQQLLFDTAWDDLDYLIVDLPPGTGDIQLTLAQKIPVAGALVVTTPQDIALLDAVKAIKMFQKLNISVLGIVENMSMHECSHCGHLDPIFGTGGGLRMAESFEVPLIGKLPLQASIREQTDQGLPPLIAEPESKISDLYREIAKGTMQQLSLRPRSDTSFKMVVE